MPSVAKPFHGSSAAGQLVDWESALPPLRSALIVLLRRRGVAGDQAEDIVQDTLGRVWERCHQLKDPARLEAWARSIALNLLRSQQVRARNYEPIQVDVPGPWPGPLDALLAAEVTGSVHRLVATLVPREHDSLLARQFETPTFRRDSPPPSEETLRLRRRLNVAMGFLKKWSAHTSAGRYAASTFGWLI